MRINLLIAGIFLLMLCDTDLQAQHNISIQKNLSYGMAPGGIRTKYYRYDLYRLQGIDTGRAPLLIMLHGGGFKLGSKTANSTPAFCRAFAQQGWICVSMNYRLSKERPLVRFRDLAGACYEAMEDLQTAIDYFKKNSVQLGIDTNRIILAGNSAGAILALQYVYANRDTLAVMAGKMKLSASFYQHPPATIRAIINCWGAVFDSTWLARTSVPIVSIHGRKDRVIPFDYNKQPIYGSGVINRQCATLGIAHALLVYPTVGHELQRHFNPFFTGQAARKRYREAAAFAGRFLKATCL